MKTFIAATLISLGGLSAVHAGSTYVDGHFRRDGTYVPGHHRTTPDSNRLNNWSTRGNTNPYTGRQGTVDPYGSSYGNYGSNNLNRWRR